MPKHIYIFSGLGADERMLDRLDFSGYSTTFIRWEKPQGEETIEQYAKRMLDQITTSRPILVGLSFGGIMAIEVARQIDTEKVIVVASAKTKKEIPFYYRWAGRLHLHKLLPSVLLKRSNLMINWFFGTTSVYDKELLRQILLDTDDRFLKWAIDKVVCWTNTTEVKNVVHIHGTRDRILPFRFVNAHLQIINGGHLMTLNRSEEVSDILQRELK